MVGDYKVDRASLGTDRQAHCNSTWNLKMKSWKRMLLDTIIFRFHFRLWQCIWDDKIPWRTLCLNIVKSETLRNWDIARPKPSCFVCFRQNLYHRRCAVMKVMAIKMLAIDHISRGVVSDDGSLAIDIGSTSGCEFFIRKARFQAAQKCTNGRCFSLRKATPRTTRTAWLPTWAAK